MEDKIFKVQHSFIDGSVHISDLQFDEGIPYIVLEWLTTYEGKVPSVRVPLEPEYLHKLGSGKVEYVYERPVVRPKRQ